MGKHRDQMAKISALPPDLLAADFSDQLDDKIVEVTRRVSSIEEQLIIIDRKLADCCGDSLKSEVAALKEQLRSLVAPPRPASPG